MGTALEIATPVAALISVVLSVYLFVQHWSKRKASSIPLDQR